MRSGDPLANDPRQRLIVALDVSTAAAAQKIVAAVGDSALTYKVGMQLYTAEGPQVVRDLVSSGRQVFLDLKYHDIPNTVGSAVSEAAKLGVSMLTVHASGSDKMLCAAVDAARARPGLMVLAVTVLTSMDGSDLEAIGMAGSVADSVVRLARIALANGCQGIVTSAREASKVRAELGKDFAIVTPGVRPAGSSVGDQKRVVTPAEAIAAGASHIVVGRPITEAADPAAEARAILAQMASRTAFFRYNLRPCELPFKQLPKTITRDCYCGEVSKPGGDGCCALPISWWALMLLASVVLPLVRPSPEMLRIWSPIFAIGIVWFAFMLGAPWLSARRQFRNTPTAHSPFTIEASDAGLQIQSAHADSKVAWSAYVGWGEINPSS